MSLDLPSNRVLDTLHSLTPRSISILPADRASQVLRDGAVRDTMNTVMHLGLNYFGMEVATISEVASDTLIVHGRRSTEDEPPPSIVGPPGVALKETVAIHDIRASRSPHVRRLAQLGDGAYIGTPISSGGKTVGLLEFTSKRPRAPFAYSDLEMAQNLARWIESEIVQAAREVRAVSIPPLPARSTRPGTALLASVESELRSPIASLLGLSTSIESLGQLNDEQRRALSAIHESGRHLLSLVDDIVELARLGTGQATLEIERVSLEDTVDRAIASVRDPADRKRIRLLTATDPRAATVRADGARLRQMLGTLLGNAIRLADIGGRVGLEVTSVAGVDAVDIAVWDDGPRLSDDEIEALLLPFDETDNAMSSHGAGLGVGLSIVHRLADLHGGSLSVDRPAKGNRFTIRLPRALTPSRPGSELVPATNVLALIVDSTGRMQSALQPLLKARGHRVLTATTFDETIDLSQMFRPDVILMDVDAPNPDGQTTLRHLRENPATSSLRIIATTSLWRPRDPTPYLEAGASELCKRPVDLDLLLGAVESAKPGEPS